MALTQRRLAATIKGRIERNDDQNESFFDSIDPNQTFRKSGGTSVRPSVHMWMMMRAEGRTQARR